MGFFADKDSDESGMMQMADDQSEVSGMMQMAGDDDVSEANLVNDLGGKAEIYGGFMHNTFKFVN